MKDEFSLLRSICATVILGGALTSVAPAKLLAGRSPSA